MGFRYVVSIGLVLCILCLFGWGLVFRVYWVGVKYIVYIWLGLGMLGLGMLCLLGWC